MKDLSHQHAQEVRLTILATLQKTFGWSAEIAEEYLLRYENYIRKEVVLTEADAQLADVMANWYERRMIAHRADCTRNCNHWLGLQKSAADARLLAAKIRVMLAE